VGFLQHLGNRASGDFVCNQSEHGISQHINRGLIASRCVELFQLLAGVAVEKYAVGLGLCGYIGFIH